MVKKIEVDQELCIGCGACVNLCPDIFELQDDGKANVINEGESKKCDCEIAINSCPVGAIKVKEE
ncbi:MAG: ferredoxin [Candidatus Pacebacteria bacterium]|nr:ferredoxin [Candidatus Paceibacterota bacterium]